MTETTTLHLAELLREDELAHDVASWALAR